MTDDTTAPQQAPNRGPDPERLARIRQDICDADRVIAENRARRARGSNTFRSAREALAWYFEKRALLSGPHAMSPRTETAPGGVQVRLDVDGGKGGDIDGVLATVATIGNLLAQLSAPAPVPVFRGRPPAIPRARYRWLLTATYAGLPGQRPTGEPGRPPGAVWPARAVARHLQCSERAVYDHIGRAEGAIARLMVERGVIR